PCSCSCSGARSFSRLPADNQGVDRAEAPARAEIEETQGRAALAGFAGSCAVSILAGVTHLLVRSVPFPSVSIAQAFVGTASGQVESFFIDALGHWAQWITLIGSALAFVLSGALIGVLLHA